MDAMPETSAEVVAWLSEVFEGSDRADSKTLAQVLAALKTILATMR